MEQVSGKVGRSIAGVAALVALSAAPAFAQHYQAGDGFMFHKPLGTLTLRAGYNRANATGDLYLLQQQQLTIGPRGFDAFNFGGDLSYGVSRRVDLGVSIDGGVRSRNSEYRGWLDNNNLPIEQTTSLSTMGFAANLKYNLSDRGRAISNFAWIPARYLPYIGFGAGIQHYSFRQKGDFVDFTTSNIFNDELGSTGWGATANVFGGMSYRLNATVSLITEARYTASSAKLHDDYTDFGRIDLSGLTMSVGTGIRF